MHYYIHGMGIRMRNVCEEECLEKNKEGYDAYWTPNEFENGERQKIHLNKVHCIVADFDDVDGAWFRKQFRLYPKPSMLVKTRRGLHAYWRLIHGSGGDPITPDDYREFVGGSMVPLGADANAKDVARVLRVPGSRYWQSSKGERFEDQEIFCEVVYDNGPEWEWNQLNRLFGGAGVGVVHRQTTPTEASRPWESKQVPGGDAGNVFWRRCNDYPVEQGILALSGHRVVRGERFSFKADSGIKRLLVNGKPSNGWIDKAGRFGSTYDETAGTLVNFLKFPEYGLTNSEIAKVFKEVLNIHG